MFGTTTPIPTPTDAPDVSGFVGQAGGLIANGIVGGYGTVLGYAIPLAILFTVVGIVWRVMKVKRTAR